MPAAPKVWLLTGAMSGFGRIITELALADGDNVVATSLDPSALVDLVEKYGPSRILTPHVDVTKPEEIAAAFVEAKEKFGGVDIVFNNAGVGLIGVVENIPEDRARKLFDVNFWGSTSVTKEALKFFREVNGPKRGGKLLVVSSAGGIGAGAIMGYYAASKHAVEAITTSAAQEIKPEWNIQIMLIEPGWMNTSILGQSVDVQVPVPEAYGGHDWVVSRKETLGKPGDPQKAMEFVYRISQREKLPFHLPVGPVPIMAARFLSAMWKGVADEWQAESARPEFGELPPNAFA